MQRLTAASLLSPVSAISNMLESLSVGVEISIMMSGVNTTKVSCKFIFSRIERLIKKENRKK